MGKWTRRALITSGVAAGGALIVGVALRPGHRAPKLAPLVAEGDEILVSSWVKIDPSNQVTVIVAHSEMGQGAPTALAQMLADEIDARWEDVHYMEAPADDAYANWALGKGFLFGDADVPAALVPTVDGALMQVAKAMRLQVTGGSLSVRATGVTGVRVAGAAARQMLINAAAQEWQVPATDLSAEDTHIVNTRTGDRAPFARFAAAAAEFTPDRSPALKSQADFKVMGHDKPRFDIPAKVDGTAMFGIDAAVDGMKYAAIVAAPVFGAQVASVDDSAAGSMPGVHRIVKLDDAVAVVADGYWHASQALARLNVAWTETGHESTTSESLFAQFDKDLNAAAASGDSTSDVDEGDVTEALANAATVVEATYRAPYLAHACMEPMNATARVVDGQCEVWVGTQNPLGFRHEVAQALDIDADNVTLHQHYLGGGFGRRANSDVAVQAALIAKDAGVPVKLIWSREEDVRHDHYRPAVTSKFRAGIGASGELVGWDNIYHEKHEPAEAPIIPYQVAARKIHHTASPTHVPFGPWRSVDHSQHGYFTEAFVDEVAKAASADPYEFRRELLAHKPRHRAVLDRAAQEAGWGETLAEGRGRGISLQESFWTLVAQVVDVSVIDGEVKVDRVVCAVDPGFAVSPDGLTAQMESGIIYGLTAALYGDIQIRDGAVVQSNFHDYPMVRMKDTPAIETHIINSGERWGGAGEPGTPGIAPALVNAIYAATGTRVRQLPVAMYDFTHRVTEESEVI